MLIKTLLAISAALALSNAAYAGEYVCKVYCNSGTTSVVVDASSASDAAKKIDPQAVADRVCKDAGKGNASSKTMGSAQCDRK